MQTNDIFGLRADGSIACERVVDAISLNHVTGIKRKPCIADSVLYWEGFGLMGVSDNERKSWTLEWVVVSNG